MDFIYPTFIAFLLIFISELGDKTQLLVLSFTSKTSLKKILLGVFLGSLFSYSIAILFGSFLGNLNNFTFQKIIKFITYLSFIIFGIITLFPKSNLESHTNTTRLLTKLSYFKLNYSLIIALSIVIGEFGDKTFLAAMGLGIQYPFYKVFLIIGSTLGMLASDSIAVFLGKFLTSKISEKTMQTISGILFLLFGLIGFLF